MLYWFSSNTQCYLHWYIKMRIGKMWLYIYNNSSVLMWYNYITWQAIESQTLFKNKCLCANWTSFSCMFLWILKLTMEQSRMVDSPYLVLWYYIIDISLQAGSSLQCHITFKYKKYFIHFVLRNGSICWSCIESSWFKILWIPTFCHPKWTSLTKYKFKMYNMIGFPNI